MKMTISVNNDEIGDYDFFRLNFLSFTLQVLYATDVTRDIMKSMLRLCLPQSHSGTERVPPSYQQMVNEETEVALKKGFIQCA